MPVFMWTNRRRAKDAIMLLVDESVSDGMTVFVRDSSVYVEIEQSVVDGKLGPAIDVITHYAEKSEQPLENLLQLDKITELYKGEGICKFKV